MEIHSKPSTSILTLCMRLDTLDQDSSARRTTWPLKVKVLCFKRIWVALSEPARIQNKNTVQCRNRLFSLPCLYWPWCQSKIPNASTWSTFSIPCLFLCLSKCQAQAHGHFCTTIKDAYYSNPQSHFGKLDHLAVLLLLTCQVKLKWEDLVERVR